MDKRPSVSPRARHDDFMYNGMDSIEQVEQEDTYRDYTQDFVAGGNQKKNFYE